MSDVLKELAAVLEARKGESPDSSYVASLFAEPDKMLEKIGEEAVETIIAAKNENREQIICETADLWFHSMVMLAQKGLSPDDILNELARRFGVSGHVQKVLDMYLDCDGDTLLLKIEQSGPACHTNRESCFYKQLQNGEWTTIEEPKNE